MDPHKRRKQKKREVTLATVTVTYHRKDGTPYRRTTSVYCPGVEPLKRDERL